MKEVWKPIQIDVVQDRYAVSTCGRIFDLQNQKYLNWSDNGAGYKIVGLQRKDKSNVAIRYIHRLVALTFIENPLNLPQVAHGDHDRSNNNLWNLKWSNQKDNTAEGIEAGRINANRPKKNRKVTPSIICEIALLSSQGKGVNEIAIMLDFPRTTISSVFNGRSNWELFEFAQQEIALNQKISLVMSE